MPWRLPGLPPIPIMLLGTRAEYIGITNSMTMHPTALYKIRMEVTIVNLYTCYRQGLVAIVGTVQQ